MKSIRIRSYSGPYFPAFGLDTERYSVSPHIQSECGKMRTRITSNRDTFYAVEITVLLLQSFANIAYKFTKLRKMRNVSMETSIALIV